MRRGKNSKVPEYTPTTTSATTTLPFMPNFSWLFSDGSFECIGQIFSPLGLPIPDIIAIAVLGWGCEPPILGKGRPQGFGDGTVRNSVVQFL